MDKDIHCCMSNKELDRTNFILTISEKDNLPFIFFEFLTYEH